MTWEGIRRLHCFGYGEIPHSDDKLRGVELPQGNVNSDTTLALGLELIENPGYSD
jgi:hypothetical protein